MNRDKVFLPLSRRGFLKGATAVVAAGGLVGCSTTNDDNTNNWNAGDYAPDLRTPRKVYSTCPVECLTHSVNCHLVGDEVIRVEPTKLDTDPYFTTACARGMSRMQFLTENRVKTPMKRIKKGSELSPLGVVLKDNSIDEWQSISWEEAFSLIGSKLKSLALNEPKSILVNQGSGNMGPIANGVTGTFFQLIAPGKSAAIGNMCCQGVDDGMVPTFGARTSDTRDSIRFSKCIISWGNNPATTSNTYWKYFMEAKQNGAKLITIDPRLSETAEKSDQWIAVKPATDVLFAIGMLRHIFREDISNGGGEDWIDSQFLQHRTNAPYLIDFTVQVKDDGTTFKDMLDNNDTEAWKYLYLLKYKTIVADGKDVPTVWNGAVEEAEENLGKTGTPTQNPDLYYIDANNEFATAYQLMRAVYAGDIVDAGSNPIGSLINTYDSNTYIENYISRQTGASEQSFKDCAYAYASSGQKSMIIQNMGGVTRSEAGGHTCAVHCILALITGNVGDKGNGVDDTSGYASFSGQQTGDIPKIATGSTYAKDAPFTSGTPHTIPFSMLGARSKAANFGDPMAQHGAPYGTESSTKDPQIKFWYIATLSLLTQYPNTGALKDALRATEMVVAAKPTWNTDAEYCDIYLPVTTPFEYEDLGAGNRNKYVQVMEAGIRPYGQARSDMQIVRGIAKYALPADQAKFFDHEDSFYVEDIINNPANNFAINGIESYSKLKNMKVIRPNSATSPWVPYHNQEFTGAKATKRRAKIFITDWMGTAEKGYGNIATSPNPARDLYKGPFPRFVPALESHVEPLMDADYALDKFPQKYQEIRSDYEFACVQIKVARSVHASFTALPWIREAFGEEGVVWINDKDASRVGITHGDVVTVKSTVGMIERKAKVTKLIMEGVVGIENGWWDKFGKLSSSTVVAELPDPMGCGHTHNSTLVNITKGGIK